MSRRVALPVVTAAYLAIVAWATLGPVPWDAVGYEAPFGVLTPSIWFERSTWAIGSPFEFTANIVMFVPIGVLFALIAGPRKWLGALAAAGTASLAIELVQIPLADRISDPRDLLANTGGAVIGIALVGLGRLVRLAWHAMNRSADRARVAR
ncbi:VanZ family protein [Agromyces silvae]|uniref:VanZ family protein n=1 Tax=Agromyces silvae TaxID=3388266 RepID=UPI00280A52A7|nr:VanZ family protein [Agromyces protaetiae]